MMRKIASYLLITAGLIFMHCSEKEKSPLSPGDVDTDTVKDIDGNSYHSVAIGTQIWMVENLKVTHYRNGDTIPIVTDNTIWSGLSVAACCAYDNDETLAEDYGYLYNGYAVNDSRGIAPAGWHVPSVVEWQILVDYLGGEDSAGAKMKESGTTHWLSPNSDSENTSGFTALPGGSRGPDGGFHDLGIKGIFGSSSECGGDSAWIRSLFNSYHGVVRNSENKRSGFSIRLIRGEVVIIPELSVSDDTLRLGSSGGSASGFSITSNTDWTVSSNADWFSFEPENGENDTLVTVRALSDNPDALTRSAVLTVSGTGTENKTVAVIQDGTSAPSLTGIQISPDNQTVTVGESLQFNCSALYSDQSTKDATPASDWSVSPSKAGTMDENGVFTANMTYSGMVVIKAVYEEFENETSLIVTGIIETGTLTDQDGNEVQTVKIGDQWWTAENLSVTHYRNGDSIPNLTDNTAWIGLSAGAYCAYKNNEINTEPYGYLYNWYAVNDIRNIAPDGWHVPTDVEWQALVDYLGGNSVAGGKMKEAGTTHWLGPNTAADNASGFTALPGGSRNYDNGQFGSMGAIAYFWSSDELDTYSAWILSLDYNYSEVHRRSLYKQSGFSVRLIKDAASEPSLTGIQISPDNQTVTAGESLQFNCSAIYSDQITKDVTPASEWSVSPPEAGTIDENGLFTANMTYSGMVVIKAVYEEFENETSLIVTGIIETGTLTDQDGNEVQTVKIGDQWWTAENLRVTHYRNGDPIPDVTDNTAWAGLSTGAYCANDNSETNAELYGYLYNWYAVNDIRNIAPSGWHVPTDEEWKTLEKVLGMSQSEADGTSRRGTDEGGKLKETGFSHWSSPNTGADNTSGFTALPGGGRGSGGDFYGLGGNTYFWSSAEYDSDFAWTRYLYFDSSDVGRLIKYKIDGFSVRLVKNSGSAPSLTGIQISPDNQTLESGETMQFNCSAVYSDQTTKNATLASDWSVSPPEAGTMDENGVFISSQSYSGSVIINASYEKFQDVTSLTVTGIIETGTLTDQDGNVVQTVKIGDQWWTAENLRVTHYRNGDSIPYGANYTSWSNLSTGIHCAYENSEANEVDYGYLYNWYAVDDIRNIAPEGWHVPTDEEWKTLEMILGMSRSEADRVEWRGTTEGSRLAGNAALWNNGNLDNNAVFGRSGFTALPGGYRTHTAVDDGIGSEAGFWAATERISTTAWARTVYFNYSKTFRYGKMKNYGYSIRLVRDTGSEPTLTGIQISADNQTLESGEKLQFNCSAVYSDQTTKNASLVSDWTVSPTGAGTINENGLFTAGPSYSGSVIIKAVYEEYEDTASLTVSGGIETGTMTDIDGNVYQTIQIGTQVWMAENLKVTHYRNGGAIPNVTGDSEWVSLTTGAYCDYDNNSSNVSTYGRLYNWYTVKDSRNIAPAGWHVPSDAEWKELEMALGMSQSEIDRMEWRGTTEGSQLAGNVTLWSDGNLKNSAVFGESGFSALPGGYRGEDGSFDGRGNGAYFWSASGYGKSLAYHRLLLYNYSGVGKYYYYCRLGFSVRLVRD